jgi:small-conductance mechanosensitive channel
MPQYYAFVAEYPWVGIIVNLITIVLLAVLAIWGLKRMLRFLARRQALSEPLMLILRSVGRWLILVFALLMILQTLGIPVTGLWGAVIATGAMVAIGFVAVWSVLSNVFCAVLMLISKPFGIGDEIELMEATSNAGLKAKVVDFNLIFTVVREVTEEGLHDDTIAVPNNLFFQKIIRRKTTPDSCGLAFHMLRRQFVQSGHTPPKPQPQAEPPQGSA